MTPRPPPSPDQSVGELALRCKRLSARPRRLIRLIRSRRPRRPRAPTSAHRSRRASRRAPRTTTPGESARSIPPEPALFHPVAQWRVEHRVIGRGGDDAACRDERGGRGRIAARRPVVALAASRKRSCGRINTSRRRRYASVRSPTSRQKLPENFRSAPSVCPRARRHFKVRVANTPASPPPRRGGRSRTWAPTRRTSRRATRRTASTRTLESVRFFC